MNWTKKELALRPGVEALVDAVIEQWVKDGKPDDDGIKPWLAIHDELRNLSAVSYQQTSINLIRYGAKNPDSLDVF